MSIKMRHQVAEIRLRYRLNIDRSAIRRAVQRARHDAELMAIAKTILILLKPEK
jgi:hypothetical protein